MPLAASRSRIYSVLFAAPTLEKIEDFVGRTLLTFCWMWSLLSQTASFFNQPTRGQGDIHEFLDSIHALLLIVFTLLAIFMTMTRRPPQKIAAGIEPRITAIAGTFLLSVLPILPPVTTPIDLQVIALPITIIGLVASIYSIWWLGQSFAVMAAARKLVTGGPYRFVRHPLYAAELIMVLGLILWNLSLSSVLLLVALALLQLRRAHHEEQVLREAFPEYEDYARRVPRIIPRLG